MKTNQSTPLYIKTCPSTDVPSSMKPYCIQDSFNQRGRGCEQGAGFLHACWNFNAGLPQNSIYFAEIDKSTPTLYTSVSSSKDSAYYLTCNEKVEEGKWGKVSSWTQSSDLSVNWTGITPSLITLVTRSLCCLRTYQVWQACITGLVFSPQISDIVVVCEVQEWVSKLPRPCRVTFD